MSRRVIGFLAMSLMANATLASTTWTCASVYAGVSSAATRHTHVHDPGAPTAAHHTRGGPAQHQAPCGTPGGPDCCSAVTPCTVALGIASSAVTIGIPVDRDEGDRKSTRLNSSHVA